MKRVVFVGQAMPRVKRNPHDWPTLNAWLYKIGITDNDIKENFFYSALVDYFPGVINGSHKVPTKEEIKKERQRLKKDIDKFNPDIIVTIGKLSLSNCLGSEVKALKDCIGKKFKINPYLLLDREVLVIPLPHPSGASIWHKRPENKILLDKALDIFKIEIK